MPDPATPRPTPPPRKTGAVPRPTGPVSRAPSTGARGRLPPGRATGRTPTGSSRRTPGPLTGTQRVAPAAPAAGRPSPALLAIAGGGVILLLLFMLFGGGRAPRRVSGALAQQRFEEASELFNQRQYPEADAVLHQLLAITSLARTEAYRRAEAFHADLHPLAEMERKARLEVPGWLERAGRFLANATSVEEGAALYDEGRRLVDRYARSTFSEDIHAKLGDLGRYKGQTQSDAAFSRYQEVADQAKALRRDKAFGRAIRLWEDLKQEAGLDPIAASKIGARIQEIRQEAAQYVESLGRQAEALRREGKAGEARRILEAARPGLQDTGASDALEALLR